MIRHRATPAVELHEPSASGSQVVFRGKEKRRLVMPSDEAIARFLGLSLGGALLGGKLFAGAPAMGALLGAIVGAGVLILHLRHAH